MSYSVFDIRTFACSHIEGFHLDAPTVGLFDSSDQLVISGWVVGNEEPISHLEIRDHSSKASCCIHSFPLNNERPDVVSHLRDHGIDQKCGFTTNNTLVGLPDIAKLSVNAQTVSGRNISLCEIKLKRAPANINFCPKIHPIIITTLGRTGSTWLMRLLAMHPSITVANQHPYETFALEFWLHLVNDQLQAPHTFLTPVDQKRFKRDFLCNEQKRSWFHNEYYSRATNFCQQAIEDYYLQVSSEQNINTARYFAEKIPYFSGDGATTWRQLSSVVRELYPTSKEIVLVRDFRDMVLSALYFGARNRIYVDIENEKPTAYLNVIKEVKEFSEYYRRHKNNTLLIRYEDLLLDTPSTLETIFTYLDIPRDTATLEAIIRDRFKVDPPHQQHITSISIADSVQRWKQELTPQLQGKYTDAFRYDLHLFGYDS